MNIAIGDNGLQLVAGVNSLQENISNLYYFVNVEDYGAVHDGITNDTAAIHAALAVNKNIFLPQGTYLCNLNISYSSYIIRGAGRQLTILKTYNNTDPVILVNGASNPVLGWGFQDLSVDGNYVVNGLEIYSTGANTVAEGFVQSIFISKCLKAICTVCPTEGWGIYQNSFDKIKMNDNLHGWWSESKSATYNNFSNSEISSAQNGGYAINEINGIENRFSNIITTGIIRSTGNGNRFIIIVETIANTPPDSIVFYNGGGNTNVDLTLSNVDTSVCSVGYYCNGIGQIINNLKSWHDAEGNEPAHLFETAAGSSGVIIHAECQDSVKASTYLTPAQLQNWTCIDGNFFDGLKGKVVYANAAPSTGTWAVKDICYNTEPASGEYVGWICTVAGTSGTWKGFGLIE